MREVQSLRLAPISRTKPVAAKPAWGNPQRFLVVGLVLVLLAAITAIILDRQFPTRFAGLPSPETERQFVRSLPTVDTIRYFRQGILPGIEIHEHSGRESRRNMVYLGLTALAGVGAIGLILVGVGVAGIVRRR
jgi:hypothetical protein